MSASNEKVYYAVGRGKEIGIYDSWKECKAQTEGFCNAKYRKFYNLEDAKEFVNFWKNYSSPVKESVESSELVSNALSQGRKATNTRNNFQSRDQQIFADLVDSDLFKGETILGNEVNRESVASLVKTGLHPSNKIEKLKSSQDIVESIQSNDQGQSKMSSSLDEQVQKCNRSLNCSSTIGDYLNMFSISKPFVTSTQEEVVNDHFNNQNKSQNHRDVKGLSSRISAYLNMLESDLNIITEHSKAESQKLKNFLKEMMNRIFVNPQMEPEGDFDKISSRIKTENGQSVGLQPTTEQDMTSAHLQSPSRMPCTHMQCSSPHSTSYEGKLTQKDVDVLALSLRLDSFEKRFDTCLKEVGGIASEISHLRTEIKELKESLKFVSGSGSSSSPKKGNDGLMQTTLSFGSRIPNRARVYEQAKDVPDSGEPEKKKGRTLKRKLSRSDSLTELQAVQRVGTKKERDSIENLLNNLQPEKVDFSTFTVDDDDFVEVYTDGSALSNGTRDARAGIGVWFGDDHPLNVAEPVSGPATNITAEIQAARVAVQLAIRAGVKKLKIHTDSEFVINCATKWIFRWKKNGWTLRNGGPVKNRKELEKLDEFASKIKVEWKKVAAHSKIKGNETADRLANEGAARYER